MNADTHRSHIGQRVIAGAALVVALVCGWSGYGFRSVPTDHDVTFITNTARPALSVQPMPVYAPQSGAIVESVPMIEANDLLAIIAALSAVAALIVSVFAFMRANPQATPAAVDVAVAERIDTVQQNREAMAVYESALQKQNDTIKMLFNGLSMGMRMLAVMTPSKALDEVADLFTDIETPGAPVPFSAQSASTWSHGTITPAPPADPGNG